MYPLQRFIAAPRKSEDILPVCAELIRGTMLQPDGNILVFLPGMDEILRLQKIVEDK